VFSNEKAKKGGEQTNLAMDIGRQSRKRTTAWPASHSRRNKGDSTSLKEEKKTNQTKEKKKKHHYQIGETTVFQRKYTDRQTDKSLFVFHFRLALSHN
jgi:flagellar motor protein MotB